MLTSTEGDLRQREPKRRISTISMLTQVSTRCVSFLRINFQILFICRIHKRLFVCLRCRGGGEDPERSSGLRRRCSVSSREIARTRPLASRWCLHLRRARRHVRGAENDACDRFSWLIGATRESQTSHHRRVPKGVMDGVGGWGSAGGVWSQQIPAQPLSRVNYPAGQMPPAGTAAALLMRPALPHLALLRRADFDGAPAPRVGPPGHRF